SNDSSSTRSSNSSSSNDSGSSNSSSKDKKKPARNSKPSAGGGSAISAGKSRIGDPYVWGGKDPGGFDCSGFVSWAYGQAGKSIPSNTGALSGTGTKVSYRIDRSEEHTSELQSRFDLVCRLLLEKKNNI